MHSLRTFALTAALCALALLWRLPALANGYDFYPAPLAWSPDSTSLLAAWSSQFPQGEGPSSSAFGELRLIQPASGTQQAVEAAYCTSPAWHPDGRSFAAIVNGSLRYYMLPQSAGGRVMAFGALSPRFDLLDCSFNPRWRESGQPLLLFSAGERFYGCDIYAWQPQSGISTLLDLGGSSVLSPLFLPDGRLACLAQGMDGFPAGAYERIMVISGGSSPGQLSPEGRGPAISPSEYHECYPLLIPGTNEMLYQRGGWGDWSIYKLNLDSGLETLEAADAQQPSLSADGRWLAFTRRDPQAKASQEYDWELPSSVWILDRSCGVESRVSADGLYAETPAVSPDGRWLAWIEAPESMAGSVNNYQYEEAAVWPPAYPAVITRQVSDITKSR